MTQASELPAHQLHRSLGAAFVEADGHLVPAHYGDPRAEHEAVRNRVGVVDRSFWGIIEAAGRDRVSFLQGMLSNDVKALAVGQGCLAALLDAHGKIVSLLGVQCLADRLLLDMTREAVAPTLAGLDKLLFSERVEFADTSDRSGLVTVAGPDAPATVEALVGTTMADLPLHHHRVTGDDLRVVRRGESRETEYDVWAPRDQIGGIWERVVALGARPVGLEAWNVLRVEAGVVWHGVDVDQGTLLLEAPLEDRYSLSKGCYLGQEVVARITYRGHVNRRIVGFVSVAENVPARGDRVAIGGTEVGRITSAVFSPALRRGIALGFLRREHWTPGTEVELVGSGGRIAARVAALPFVQGGGTS